MEAPIATRERSELAKAAGGEVRRRRSFGGLRPPVSKARSLLALPEAQREQARLEARDVVSRELRRAVRVGQAGGHTEQAVTEHLVRPEGTLAAGVIHGARLQRRIVRVGRKCRREIAGAAIAVATE